jgi:hypothetical protein
MEIYLRIKVKLSLVLNWVPRHENTWGSGGIARHYFYVCGWLHAPAALPPRRDPLYPFDRRLSSPQKLEVVAKKNPALLGIKPRSSSPYPYPVPYSMNLHNPCFTKNDRGLNEDSRQTGRAGTLALRVRAVQLKSIIESWPHNKLTAEPTQLKFTLI